MLKTKQQHLRENVVELRTSKETGSLAGFALRLCMWRVDITLLFDHWHECNIMEIGREAYTLVH